MVLLVCNHLNLIKQFGQMLFVLICYNEKDSSFQTAFRTRARGWCSPWDRFWQSLVIANFAKLITFVNRQRILLRSTDSNMQWHNICVSYCILIVIIHNSLWTYSNINLASINVQLNRITSSHFSFSLSFNVSQNIINILHYKNKVTLNFKYILQLRAHITGVWLGVVVWWI